MLRKPNVDGPSEVDGPAETFGTDLCSSVMRLKLELGREGFFGFGRLIESVTYLNFIMRTSIYARQSNPRWNILSLFSYLVFSGVGVLARLDRESGVCSLDCERVFLFIRPICEARSNVSLAFSENELFCIASSLLVSSLLNLGFFILLFLH